MRDRLIEAGLAIMGAFVVAGTIAAINIYATQGQLALRIEALEADNAEHFERWKARERTVQAFFRQYEAKEAEDETKIQVGHEDYERLREELEYLRRRIEGGQ